MSTQNLNRVRAEIVEVLGRHVAPGSDVALLDFPSYMNVGDSMIWAGMMEAVRNLRLQVRYVADMHRFDEVAMNREISPSTTILLQGGGNFGDIWPEFQSFRERIALAFPRNPIVQMPQSVLFRDERNAARSNRILHGHPNFRVLVREESSFERMQEQLPDVNVDFCHDLAFMWTPHGVSARRRRSNVKPLILARNDREVRDGGLRGLALGAEIDRRDWGLRGGSLIVWRLVRIPARIGRLNRRVRRNALFTRLMRLTYPLMLKLNLRAGVALFDGRPIVVTDRLHAHVLCSLLNIPQIVSDNDYGKVRDVYNATSSRFCDAQFVESGAVAVATMLDATSRKEK